MSIETVVAGPYTGTYNAIALGMTDDGFELEFNSHAEMIANSDLYGQSLLDLIYQGGSHRIMFSAKVYKAGTITPFWPWGALGVIATTAAPVGRLGSAVAAPLVQTVVANTPAAVAGPSTLTASKAILAPSSNLKLLFTSKMRRVPVQQVCLPSETGGTVSCFTTT